MPCKLHGERCIVSEGKVDLWCLHMHRYRKFLIKNAEWKISFASFARNFLLLFASRVFSSVTVSFIIFCVWVFVNVCVSDTFVRSDEATERKKMENLMNIIDIEWYYALAHCNRSFSLRQQEREKTTTFSFRILVVHCEWISKTIDNCKSYYMDNTSRIHNTYCEWIIDVHNRLHTTCHTQTHHHELPYLTTDWISRSEIEFFLLKILETENLHQNVLVNWSLAVGIWFQRLHQHKCPSHT